MAEFLVFFDRQKEPRVGFEISVPEARNQKFPGDGADNPGARRDEQSMIAAAQPKPVADEGLGPFETLDSWRTSRNRFTSSAYLPALVRKRTSSHRRSGLPIPCGAIWCRNPKKTSISLIAGIAGIPRRVRGVPAC